MQLLYFKCIVTCCVIVVNGVQLDEWTTHNINDVHEFRSPKFFPFFSIIRFLNTECKGGTSFNGTCFTRRECNDLGGSYSGTCASKRGVCCIIQKTCGSSTNVNNTYFTNAGYPGSFGGGGRCSIAVNRCNSDICQLRLDLLEMTLGQPDANGNCVSDALTVSGGGSDVPRICGDNSGQHVYVDFDGDAPITISLDASSAVNFNRRWNIKITQLACNSITLAPSGCLKYYTRTSGIIQSFNYGTMQNQAVLTTTSMPGTRQIVNQNYGVCVRMASGYCSIRWSQTSGDMYSFTITGDIPGQETDVLGTTQGAIQGTACTTDFVIIPNPTISSTGLPAGVERFCGFGFVPITTASKPFVMTIVTDGDEGNMDIANRGFSLMYSQQQCLPN